MNYIIDPYQYFDLLLNSLLKVDFQNGNSLSINKYCIVIDENSGEKMSSVKSGSATSVSTVDEKSGENSEETDSAKYARLISEAKELTSDGEVKAALDLYKEAAKICPSEKLTRKMERIEVNLHVMYFI